MDATGLIFPPTSLQGAQGQGAHQQIEESGDSRMPRACDRCLAATSTLPFRVSQCLRGSAPPSPASKEWDTWGERVADDAGQTRPLLGEKVVAVPCTTANGPPAYLDFIAGKAMRE